MQRNTRDEARLLKHTKSDVPKIVIRKPSPSEGNTGDIAFGNTPDGIKLFTKIGTKWYTFSADSTSPPSGLLHIMHGGWDTGTSSASDSNYLPFRTPDVDASDYDGSMAALGIDNENLCYMFPFDGVIKKIMLRATLTPGDTVLTIDKAKDGESRPPEDGITIAVSTTVDMAVDDTAYTFNFDRAHIAAGEIISILCNPTSNWGSVMYTIVIEYD